MLKKILAVLVVLVVIIAGGQSAFWFFKVGKLEKYLTTYSAKSDSPIEIEGFEISGFPLRQNVNVRGLKVKSPELLSKENVLHFDKLTITSSIFSNIFEINFSGKAFLIDSDKKRSEVSFIKKPSAQIKISPDGLSSFSYKDLGYKLLGDDTQEIYTSGANDVAIVVTKNESGQIIYRTKASSKNTQTFDLIKFYQDNYENSIVDGLKTGKIKIGMKELQQKQSEEESATITIPQNIMSEFDNKVEEISSKIANGEINTNEAENIETKIIESNNQESQEVATSDQDTNQVATDNQEVAKETSNNPATVTTDDNSNKNDNTQTATNDLPTTEQVRTTETTNNEQQEGNVAEQQAAAVNPQSADQATTEDNPAISNASQETQNNTSQQQEAQNSAKQHPVDDRSKKLDALLNQDGAGEDEPKKTIAKKDINIDIEYILTPAQSDSSPAVSDPTKITQVVTTYNKSYKINRLELKSESFSIIVNGQLEQPKDDTNMSGFATVKIKMVDKFVEFVQSSFRDIATQNDTKIQSFDASYNTAIVKNAYASFLSVVSDNLPAVTTDIAAKNQLSQNQTAVFDIRREKNLDIVINETPIREIVGRF